MSPTQHSLSISTHVLDAALGAPAAQVSVVLDRRTESGWEKCDRGRTNSDGRIGAFDGLDSSPESATYRLTFDTGAYFAATGQVGFYPEVSISFTVTSDRHYHVPVLLSPFAFSTYRGS